MVDKADGRNKLITQLLNGTNTALKQIIPIEHNISKPVLIKDSIHLDFGVLIGIVGDMKGKLMLAGDTKVFGAIGEKMFSVQVSEEMLASFSGELGNMLAGNLSTNIVKEGISIDITSPSIIEGNASVSGFMLALQMSVTFIDTGNLYIYLALD